MPEENELRPTPEMDAVIAADSGGGDFIKALADKGKQLERERDRLLEALKESLALNINWADVTEPHDLEYFSEYRAVIAQAKAAIAEVEGHQ